MVNPTQKKFPFPDHIKAQWYLGSADSPAAGGSWQIQASSVVRLCHLYPTQLPRVPCPSEPGQRQRAGRIPLRVL